MSLHQVAEELTRSLGRTVRYVPQSAEQAHSGLLQAGLDPWMAAVLAEYRVAYGSGWGDFTTDDVATVLGRQPRSVAQFVHDHRERFPAA